MDMTAIKRLPMDLATVDILMDGEDTTITRTRGGAVRTSTATQIKAMVKLNIRATTDHINRLGVVVSVTAITRVKVKVRVMAMVREVAATIRAMVVARHLSFNPISRSDF